jgi:hypothetical protein
VVLFLTGAFLRAVEVVEPLRVGAFFAGALRAAVFGALFLDGVFFFVAVAASAPIASSTIAAITAKPSSLFIDLGSF